MNKVDRTQQTPCIFDLEVREISNLDKRHKKGITDIASRVNDRILDSIRSPRNSFRLQPTNKQRNTSRAIRTRHTRSIHQPFPIQIVLRHTCNRSSRRKDTIPKTPIRLGTSRTPRITRTIDTVDQAMRGLHCFFIHVSKCSSSSSSK
jgi:hypothetical protein